MPNGSFGIVLEIEGCLFINSLLYFFDFVFYLFYYKTKLFKLKQPIFNGLWFFLVRYRKPQKLKNQVLFKPIPMKHYFADYSVYKNPQKKYTCHF